MNRSTVANAGGCKVVPKEAQVPIRAQQGQMGLDSNGTLDQNPIRKHAVTLMLLDRKIYNPHQTMQQEVQEEKSAQNSQGCAPRSPVRSSTSKAAERSPAAFKLILIK